ncbi:pheromone A receptor-domain-containing protein [Xylaria cubensis]|nr:pheromone A receptor-domain-containing protein [Xylaria cubensis]
MEQAPATNPGLLANLVSRVILAFASILVSWVPFRLLVRNGEFAAVVFIVDVATINLITIVNSVIWHDDDWSTWWDGAGLCDIEVYLIAPLQTIYAASIFTIMYHLAQQVKVTGAARGRSERTRRNLIQAAIIFPVPLVQLIFTWFDLAQRYIIGTLIGCSAVYDASWPKILVYDAPPAVFALLAVPYAVLLWRRYHAITKQAQGILKSDGEASIRANRTRRRLYNMSLSILVVYVPIMIYFLVCNIKDTLPSYKAYDYNRMHWSATPYPWETILFVPSWIIPSDVINQPWISIATTVVIMAFFGMTIEARQIYRQYAGYLRLQTCFQKLKWKRDQDPSLRDENGKTLPIVDLQQQKLHIRRTRLITKAYSDEDETLSYLQLSDPTQPEPQETHHICLCQHEPQSTPRQLSHHATHLYVQASPSEHPPFSRSGNRSGFRRYAAAPRAASAQAAARRQAREPSSAAKMPCPCYRSTTTLHHEGTTPQASGAL